jgi:hypothetical protein
MAVLNRVLGGIVIEGDGEGHGNPLKNDTTFIHTVSSILIRIHSSNQTVLLSLGS